MDQLWAPWRMKYLLNNSQNHAGCFLCEALAQKDDKKTYILHRAKHSFVIMNLYPYNPGHLLIAPNPHKADIDDLTIDELTDLMKTTQAAVTVLKQAMKPDGLNIGINIGKAAGAGLAGHLHVHLVPRWSSDTNFTTVLDNTRVMPELLDGTYARLKPYFERIKE
jgi:ATP adenylyltransferase